MTTAPGSTRPSLQKAAAAAKKKGARKPKTAADLKAEIAAKQKKLAELELLEYADQLQAEIKTLRVPELFKKLKEAVNGSTDIAILAAMGKVMGIKRLVVQQAPVKPRKAAKT